MFEFGSGSLWGNPIGGNEAANPTPTKFGTLQDISLDISGDAKQLYGQKQFPEAVARGKCKISGKAKFAHINGKQLNDLFFGQTMGAGMAKTITDESGTIAAGTVTVAQHTTYLNDANAGDLGVIYQATGVPLTKVSGSPQVGQYSVSVSTGVYTFNTGENGTTVLISYRYTPAATGSQLNINNQLMGFAPTILITLNGVFVNNGVTSEYTITLFSALATKLTWATKQEDFIIPEFDFECFANPAGQVIKMELSE